MYGLRLVRQVDPTHRHHTGPETRTAGRLIRPITTTGPETRAAGRLIRSGGAAQVRKRVRPAPRVEVRAVQVRAGSSRSDGYGELGDRAHLGVDRDVLGEAAARDDADGPVAGAGEEAEDALVGDDDLAGELTGVVEQSGVGGARAGHVTLDDGLGGEVDAGGQCDGLLGRGAPGCGDGH